MNNTTKKHKRIETINVYETSAGIPYVHHI